MNVKLCVTISPIRSVSVPGTHLVRHHMVVALAPDWFRYCDICNYYGCAGECRLRLCRSCAFPFEGSPDNDVCAACAYLEECAYCDRLVDPREIKDNLCRACRDYFDPLTPCVNGCGYEMRMSRLSPEGLCIICLTHFPACIDCGHRCRHNQLENGLCVVCRPREFEEFYGTLRQEHVPARREHVPAWRYAWWCVLLRISRFLER